MSKITFYVTISALILILTTIGCQKRLDKAALDLGETLSPKATTNTKRTITGQGAFIDFDVRGTYTTNGSKTFEFDKTAAESYFTHNDGILASTPVFTKTSTNSGGYLSSVKVTSCTGSGQNVVCDTVLPSQYWPAFGFTAAPARGTYIVLAGECVPLDPGSSAPQKDASKLDQLLADNACTFLNGGTLTSSQYSKSFSSSSQSCGKNIWRVRYEPNGNVSTKGWYVDSLGVTGYYTYTYSYNITANEATKVVAPNTSWTEVAFNLGDGPTIPVAAFISRLQATSQQNPDGSVDFSTTKYTFNLESQVTDPNTGITTWQSNISGIKIEVLDAQGVVINGSDGMPLVVSNPPHYVESNYNPETPLVLPKKGDPGSVDFNYAALAAANLTYGTSIQLYDFSKNGVIDSADIKDARTILNTDGFANNQDGGLPYGKALQKARMPAQPIQFPGSLVGEYQIRISANVSGLTSTSTQSIIHTQKINIIANCNNIK